MQRAGDVQQGELTMEHNFKKRFWCNVRRVIGGGCIVALMAPFSASGAENLTLHGKPMSEWVAGWWQWQEANYPGFAFGDGLVDCSLGQSGPVFFLGGTGGGVAERECDQPIRGHKHLMFPLVNANVFNPDNFCELSFGDPNCSIVQKREVLDGIFSEDPPGLFNSTACLLSAEVDGIPAVYSGPIIRAQSSPHPYGGDPESVADGFWVVLQPLAKGEHTIQFTGGICDVDTGDVLFDVDVTYSVTVSGAGKR
jgi:hypothetical protein